MTKIILSLEKSVEQNAAVYFDAAKKKKKKLEGAIEALGISEKKLSKIKIPKEVVIVADRKKSWYEKFRWFYSSEGFLVIGGRDATSNEILIKKHTDPDDIVLHTDMAGSPFFVIKADGKKIGKPSIRETADATASYSRGWKKGLAEQNVFYVKPSQVTKQAKSGESLQKGAFMIYGKTNYIDNSMQIAIGIQDGVVIGGPVDSIKNQTKEFVCIVQGSTKPSDIAKKIKKKIGGSLDDIIRFLPPGLCDIK